MTNILLNFLLLALACNVFTIQLLIAQPQTDFAREIQRLNREIERVGELATSFNNRHAIDLIDQAKQKRDLAINYCRNNQFIKCKAEIKTAFSLLELAARKTLEGPVRRLKNQLEECLRITEDRISRCPNDEAQRILNEVKKSTNEAERAFRAGQIEKAIEFARVALTLCNRAGKLLNQRGCDEEDLISDIRHKYERLLGRARDAVDKSRNERGSRILHQAIQLAQNAEKAYFNHNLELAKKLLNRSILLLLRTMDVASADSPTAVNNAEIALFKLREKLASAQPIINRSKNKRANILFERAKQFEREAEHARQQGKNYQTLWKTELGMNMLRRARKVLQKKTSYRSSNRITEEIETTKNEIAQARSTLIAASPKDVVILLNMSQTTVLKAEQAMNAGFSRVALEAVLAAQRFLARAELIVKNGNAGILTREPVQFRLNQLDAVIAEAEEKIMSSPRDWRRQLLQNAKELRKVAFKSLQQGNYQAANEGIQVAFELLRKSMKQLDE